MDLSPEELPILQNLLGKVDPSDLADLLGKERAPLFVEAASKTAEQHKAPQIWTLRELFKQYTDYRPALVEGLLRRGEIMNVISTAKRGKTWMIMDLALAVAAGTPWMGFKTIQGNVLVLDNELHPETITMRGRKVVEARAHDIDAMGDNIFYLPMRGRLRDIDWIVKDLMALTQPLALVVIDALYRTYPARTDENDNGTMAVLYNKLDEVCLKMNCAMALVHHASKGSQAGKSVTDVGSGAGAFGRATDTHLILRAHEEPEAVVLEAVPRTWEKPVARCFRFQYPLWEEANDLNPADLAGLPGRKKKNGGAPGAAGATAPSVEPTLEPNDFAKRFVTHSEMTWKQVQLAAEAAGVKVGEKKVITYLESAATANVIVRTDGKKRAKLYSPPSDRLLSPPDAQNAPESPVQEPDNPDLSV